MKLFVTGVAGQLGHDVMNELNKRGYEGVGSDLAPEYSGIQDGTAVTTMPYVSVDITNASAVEKAITEAGVDGVVHCAAWTAVDAAEDEDKQEIVRKVNVLDTVCKFGFWQPAQFVVDLGWINSITHVMTLAVCYVCDQALWFSKFFADDLNDVDVFHFVVSAYIVNLTNTSFVDDQVDSAAVILNIQPVTNILTFSINRKWLVI